MFIERTRAAALLLWPVHFPHKVTSSSALDINQVTLDKQPRFGFRAPACAWICAHDRLAALGKRWKSLTFFRPAWAQEPESRRG